MCNDGSLEVDGFLTTNFLRKNRTDEDVVLCFSKLSACFSGAVVELLVRGRGCLILVSVIP